MKALTLRGIPKEIEKIIKKKALKKHLSLNKAVINLLEERTGKKVKKNPVYHDLDYLCGSWSKHESQEFNKTLSKQRIIDKDIWK